MINRSSSMSYSLYTEIKCQSDLAAAEKLKTAMQECQESSMVSLSLGRKQYLVLLEPVMGVSVE